ncbi:MAG: GDSL-type esterase/lipase family protein [Thermoanaerobaculia bacterium]|nr:GDSL-type esterase/lipase family protein [Thermoanaerobaculia bacterium]
MQPLLYHLYSGQLFFSAAILMVAIAAASLVGLLEGRPALRSVCSVIAMASIPAAALSGTPMPAPRAALLLGATLPFALFGIAAPPRRRTLLAAIAMAATIAGVAAESRWHLPVTPLSKPRRIIVVGDSLSSGGFGESQPWPQIVASQVGAELQNLALAGETASSAIQNQLPDIPPSRAGDCVVIAIGGNDMLDRLPPGGFESALAQILEASVAGGQRNVVILELPIVPGEWRYGTIQRRLATRHAATLIPKRLLAGVLLDPANTYDGLHPTQRGHARIASEIRAALRW